MLAQALMEADVTARVGAAKGERNPMDARPSAMATGTGAGHPGRHGRAGDPEVAAGQLLPDWLLEPRRRGRRGWPVC